jgi:hypothetical protein
MQLSAATFLGKLAYGILALAKFTGHKAAMM